MPDSKIRIPETREILEMNCRCCGQKTVRLVIDLGDQPEANRLVDPTLPLGAEPSYPLRFGYCETCTMMQIDHTIPRDLMYQGNVYVSSTSKTLSAHFAETTQRMIETYGIGPRDLVVDIGSNDGSWVLMWQGKAFAVGVEPDRRIAAIAEQRGARTENRYFDRDVAIELRRCYGPAKLITSNGSFFHMEDLHGACEGIYELLADDGVFIVQALSGEKMLADTAFDQILHEHLCYYTPESFQSLLLRHGMGQIARNEMAIQGGSWEYHIQKYCFFINPHVLPGASLPDVHAFAYRVLKAQERLMWTLEDYKRRGKSVWSYGAPGKATTLFNSFGIGPDLVQFAVEANPLKFGKAIPGCRIPIIREGDERPDAYLVTAWNFLDEFIAKEREYLLAGGEFIVPVPHLRVITKDDVV